MTENKTMSLCIRDLIEVPPVQTVIRLDEASGKSQAVTGSFVFTADISDHISVLSEALSRETGKGYFIQGNFGSGKSHFLAAITAWLAEKTGAERLTNSHEGLELLRRSGRRFLPVAVSLVKYRSITPLERIITSAIELQLLEHGVEVSLSPLTIFQNRFMEILEEPKLAEAFNAFCGKKREAVNKWFAENQREAYAVCVKFLKNQGLKIPEILIEDRHEIFARAINAVREAGFDGTVILIDELSEFFRSKADGAQLNEDARTLQFLGELTFSEPIWIIAAVQESIERTGDIAQATFRKIKDRFPIKFHLSTLHIRDLISKRLVKKKSGADEHVYRIYQDYQKHFPTFSCEWDHFRSIYPVHPTTLSLLEGLGELFSQHRGIVDFVYSQLSGDPGRQIAGLLDRPCFELLAPDSIYEHFSPRLSEFSSFHRYPHYVIPHLDEVIDHVIEDKDDRIIARRLVRILVLYAMHPTAEIPDVRALTELSACMLASHTPYMNVQFIAGALLDPLVEHSRFLVKEIPSSGNSLQTVYTVVTQDDHGKTLKAKITRATNELDRHDTRLVMEPLAELPASHSWPGPEILNDIVERNITWRLSTRRAVVAFIHKGMESHVSARVNDLLSGGKADFALVMTLGKVDLSCNHTAIWCITVPGNEENILRAYLAARMIKSELSPSNPADAPLLPLINEKIERIEQTAHQALVNLIYSGNFENRDIHIDPAALQMKRFDRLLEAAGEYLCEKRYPKFKEIASRFLQPSPRVYQNLYEEFVAPGSLSMSEARNRGLTQPIDSIVTPLGLVEVKSGSYRLSPNPGDHAFLSYIFNLLRSSQTTPLDEVLYNMHTESYGIPSDMAEFLLASLAHCGLVSLMNRGKTVPLDFLRLSSVANADTIAPGEIIGQADRDTLLTDCRFLAPPGGFVSFGLRQQQDAWQAVIKLKKSLETLLNEVNGRVAAASQYSAFESFNMDSLYVKLESFKKLINEIKVSYSAREGLERFLKKWRALGLVSEDIEYIKKINHFLKHSAEHFIFLVHYLRHHSVENAINNDAEVSNKFEALPALLKEPEITVIMDEGAELSTAFDFFREAYCNHYRNQHDLYYKASVRPNISKFAVRILVILRRLASIESLDRPVGLENLLIEIDKPVRTQCKRNVDEELLRSPVCGCGFQLDDKPQKPLIENPEALIEESLDEYFHILRSSEVLESITVRAYALKDENTRVSKRLKNLCKLLKNKDESCRGALLDLLDEQTISEVEQALSGKTIVENRDLGDLVSALSGRRLTRKKVKKIVEKWISNAGEETILSIEGISSPGREIHRPRANWWPLLRPDIFSEKDAEISISELHGMERSIEELLPIEVIKQRISNLDNNRLIKFITEEPIYTKAVRAAWLILAQRALNRSIDVPCFKTESRLLHSSEAAACVHRLKQLKALSGLLNASFPDRMRARIYCASVIHDSWATSELQSAAESTINEISAAGTDWLHTLPALEPLDMQDWPVVLIIDALPPDVWMEVYSAGDTIFGNPSKRWFRLDAAPHTVPAMNALFGFSDDRDPIDEFKVRNIRYFQFEGNESHSLIEMIPSLESGEAVVVRLAVFDRSAHSGSMHLCDLPKILRSVLSDNLPRFIKTCAGQKKRLVLTTDHGLTFSKKRLFHGSGGIFEQALFRLEWQ